MSESDNIATSWHERHRPQVLAELALDAAVRERFETIVNSGLLPDHLLLAGPPGIGKTTLARVVLKATGCQDVLELNASKDRGIDIIRDKVETFAKTYPWGGGWKAVFLDEADGLTPEAQESMRGLMEKYRKRVWHTTDSPVNQLIVLRSTHSGEIAGLGLNQRRSRAGGDKRLELASTPSKERRR